jgi:hypothetical protein
MGKKPRGLFRGLFWPSVASVILACSIFVLTGCGSNTSAYDPYTEYARACEDAANITTAKISKNLTPIIPENTNLVWENNIVGSRVLVVSWVNQTICNSYKCPAGGCQPTDTCKEGKECQYGYDNYVTLAPELKNFFKDKTVTTMRIAQLLGLPPTDATNKACILEMWVSPGDLFRPSPDPEVTDQVAEIAFPGDNKYGSRFRQYSTSELVYADMPCDTTQCPSCIIGNGWSECGFTTYENYIKNRKKYIYTIAKPYPWTSLGYTYDWGDSINHVGLSEFVLNGKKSGGSKISVGIKAVTATLDYFTN